MCVCVYVCVCLCVCVCFIAKLIANTCVYIACSITSFQIHHEAKVEEEKEKQFVAQAFAGGMKHGGGSRRGSTKPDDWPGGGKGDRDRDRRDKDRDRDRERDRDRDKPKEKLDARKLQFTLLKQREKSKDPGVHTCTCTCVFQYAMMCTLCPFSICNIVTCFYRLKH